MNRTPSHVPFSSVSQHTFQCRPWHWLKMVVRITSLMRSVCSDLSSTLHFALFTVSLIFLFILLIFIFIFHVGRFGEKYPVRFREWGVRHFGRQHASHRLWAQNLRRLPHLRDHWNLHPGVFRRQQALELAWLGNQWLHHPSAERSLHHSSLRSDKIQRAVDKLINLLKKVCCQVSRCLSVMYEQGDLFPMSLDPSFQTS